MATTDRTTIKAAIEELTTKLRTNLVADPPTATKPFRRVEIADTGVEQYPRPFLTLLLTRTQPVGVADNDRLVEVTMTLRVVTDVAASDPHAAMLDTIGAVEDYFDSILDAGVIEGAEGFVRCAFGRRFGLGFVGAGLGGFRGTFMQCFFTVGLGVPFVDLLLQISRSLFSRF